MGRFRVNSNNKTISSGDYNNRLQGLNTIIHARTKDKNKGDENFIVDYNTYNIKHFKSYKDYITAAKAYFIINPHYNSCPDVPIDIKQGLQSKIYYNELLEHVYNCKSYSCVQCDIILKLDICKNKQHILYPHGHFNNNSLGRNFKFPVKIDLLHCNDYMDCPKYSFCKCPAFWDEKCCKYQVMFPSECKFIYYTEQSKPLIHDSYPHDKCCLLLIKKHKCCLPLIKKHKCCNCPFHFAPPCSSNYNCPKCNHRYNKGHYLTEHHNFNCHKCNHCFKLDPYFISSCNHCHKKYKPHGKHCNHIKKLSHPCAEIKEKHIHAFSVYPKLKSNNEYISCKPDTKIINECPRDKYFRKQSTI